MIISIQGISNISQIRKLLLGNNKLQEFPACKQLKVLNVLNLKQNYLSDISNILLSDFPQLQQLIISEQLTQNDSDIIVENISSKQQLTGYTNSNKSNGFIVIKNPKLKYFQSQNNGKLFVNKQIAFYSDSLQKITLNSCSIDKIIFERRQCVQNLKYLHLSGNKIKYFSFLSANLAKARVLKDASESSQLYFDNKPINNDSMIQLILSNNEIQNLPVMRFSALKKLNLSSNKIKDIRPLEKSKLPQLQYLSLSNNLFVEIRPFNFSKLQILELQKLRQLSNVNSLFTGDSFLPFLKTIFFSNCQKIDFYFNVNPKNNVLTQLKELYFTQVNFSFDTKQNLIFDVPTLQKLALQSCSFKQFPLVNLPKVKQLNLYDIKAQSFKCLELSKLSGLQYLNLNECKQGSIFQQSHIDNLQTPQINLIKPHSDLSTNLFCDFNFPELKALSISNSIIGSLKGLQKNIFSKLQSLKLSSVETKDGKIPKIKAPNLITIDVNQMKIPNADVLLESGFGKLVNLYLQHNQIELISDKVLSSLVNIKYLSLADNKLKVFVCSKSLDKLIELNLSLNELTSFPRIKAKNLTKFSWDGNKFTDISELQNCQLFSMDTIDLNNCDLSKTGLPKLNMPGLQRLIIMSSKLSNIQNLSKSNLPSLRQLNLSYNEIVDFPIVEFVELRQLVLQNNKISKAQFLQKSRLQALSVLKLTSNKFSYLPQFSQFSHLKVFECHFIKIERLPTMDAPQLQQLTVTYAELSDISDFIKGDYKALTFLNLSNNKLKNLSRVYMQSLKIIIFDSNQIQDISEFIDSDLPVQQLEWISFAQNRLTKIPDLPFPNINRIYFNSNPLKQFNSLILPQYPDIVTLSLSNTLITKMPNLPKLPKLQSLWFDNTSLEDITWLANSGANLPVLKRFDGTNSKITKIPNLNNLKALKQLVLKENPINDVNGLISTTNFAKIYGILIDLDVGNQYEKLKKQILDKNKDVSIRPYKKKL